MPSTGFYDYESLTNVDPIYRDHYATFEEAGNPAQCTHIIRTINKQTDEKAYSNQVHAPVRSEECDEIKRMLVQQHAYYLRNHNQERIARHLSSLEALLEGLV